INEADTLYFSSLNTSPSLLLGVSQQGCFVLLPCCHLPALTFPCERTWRMELIVEYAPALAALAPILEAVSGRDWGSFGLITCGLPKYSGIPGSVQSQKREVAQWEAEMGQSCGLAQLSWLSPVPCNAEGMQMLCGHELMFGDVQRLQI
ncbi:hypothetical protein Nmel_017741, partial [Mimus melanotis]